MKTTTAIIDAHHDELAAVIVEPLQRVLAPQPGFLQGLRELTARHDIPLIFDEVVTSFRLAYGGAQEFYGVTPDMCSVGKIMGGGYPLAAVMGRSDIMSVYDEATAEPDSLNGDPIACAAGLATRPKCVRRGVYENLRATGSQLRQALVDICNRHGVALQMCGEDPIFDVYFIDHPVSNYRDTLSADTQMMVKFNAALLERGILKGNQKFYPSVVHTQEDVEKTIQAFEEIIPSSTVSRKVDDMRKLKSKFTAEDLHHLPSTDQMMELVRGKAYEIAPARGRHGSVARRIASRLGNYADERRLGEVFAAETGFILRRNSDTVRAPDAAFVSEGRLPEGDIPAGYPD